MMKKDRMSSKATEQARGEVRAVLLRLAELAAKTEAAERRILASALDRLDVVHREMGRLRPHLATDCAASDHYTELTVERGQFEIVLARSWHVLGE